jgi:hypothetical protein
MADQSEVEQVLVAQIAAALYPTGTANPSIDGNRYRVFRGWPKPDDLDKALTAGIISVWIYTPLQRETTRFSMDWQTRNPPVHTIAAAVVGNTVTFSGTPSASQIAAIKIGHLKAYAYAVQGTDSLTAIATALATLVAVDLPGTTSAGPAVTVSHPGGIVAAGVGATGTGWRELKRQDVEFQICIGAATIALRDAAAKVIDPALARLTRLSLPDGSVGWIRFSRSITLDSAEKDNLYRRDLHYWVEYPTSETEVETEIITQIFKDQASQLPQPQPPTVPTVTIIY